ncbi:MAG: type II toxin-antitoxin system PemK/MazF family toxin [Eubacteriales bacterium]|nr:type II toxin-antitoxin system PemK/MazF family toxin [Eubacteriales bacterium]
MAEDLTRIVGQAFDSLKQAIFSRDKKHQKILSDWISQWSTFITSESAFEPEKMGFLKRGTLLLVNFGFNVGCETGGVRFAVVIENNNNSRNGTIVVVPLSSLPHDKCRDDLYESEVYLGEIIEGDEHESYAKVKQIRTISKMRILKRAQDSDGKDIKLSEEFLDEIDNVLLKCLTKTEKFSKRIVDKSKKT